MVIHGASAAIERFRALYAGTWQLTVATPPEALVIDRNTVQVAAPVTFTTGAHGTRPSQTALS